MFAADILITDYSSCFFDYLLLDKPIVHYIYDYSFFRNEDRGLYYDAEDVCAGECPKDIESLIHNIEEYLNDSSKDSNLRKERLNKYVSHNQENNCNYLYNTLINKIYG